MADQILRNPAPYRGFIKPGSLDGYLGPISIFPGTTTATLNASRFYYIPFYYPGLTITKIGAEITTGAAGAAVLGFYSDVDGTPTALLKQATGTIDTNVTSTAGAPTELTLTGGFTFPNAIVWAAWNASAGPTVRTGTAATTASDQWPFYASNAAASTRGYLTDTTLGYNATMPSSAYVSGLATAGNAPLITIRL